MGNHENSSAIWNGAPLLDIDGNPVHAHGGHMLAQNGFYYWFGENRTGRCKVSCYRSADLTNWEWLNDVLTLDSRVMPIYHRTSLELESLDIQDRGYGKGAVIERPKVLYNALTSKYVMWMHWENGRDYSDARCGVADCDTIDGDYTYRGSFNPVGNMSRDCTLFQDDDGTAYFVSAARENADLIIYRLSPDYLSIEEQVKTLWPGQAREAPALMKRNGIYFLISSACTGWLPNQGTYAWAEQLTGRWSPLMPLGDSTTYDTQPAFIVPVTGTDDGHTSYLYVGDRWDPADYYASSYVFLPLDFPSDREMEMNWADRTVIDLAAGTLKGESGAGSGLYRLKSVGTGLYLAAGDAAKSGEAVNAEVRMLSYADKNQQWTVEFAEDGTASLRNAAAALCLTAANSLAEESPMNKDTEFWRVADAEGGVLLIDRTEGKVLTAVREKQARKGRLTLEPKSPHDPRLGPDRQLFQWVPVR